MSLIKNTVLYTVGNLVISLASFLLLPLYTKYLTVADFGIVSSMQIFSSILIVFFTLSFDRSLVRVYHDYPESKKKEFAGTIFITIILISIIVLALCFTFQNLISNIFVSIPFHPFFSYTIVYTFFFVIVSYSQTFFQVQQKPISFLVITLSMFFLTTFLNIYYVWYLREGSLGYVKGLLYGAAISFPISLFLLRNELKLSYNLKMLRNAAVFCLPMCLNLLASWVLNLSDRLFIDHYFSQTEVGLYSFGYKLASVVTMAGVAISMAYNPMFYDIVNTQEDVIARNRIKKYNNLVVLSFGIITSMIVLWSDIILKAFFREEYFKSLNVINLLCIGFLIAQISGLFNLMAYQKKKTGQVAIIMVFCAVSNILLNYFLIPIYGYFVAVFSTIFSNSINLILLYFLVKRNYYIPLNWKQVLIILLVIIALTILSNFVLPLWLMISFKALITICFGVGVYVRKDVILNNLKIK